MFRILVILFILVPIIEIAVFIQVGELFGLSFTLLIIVITAIFGVHLLKQQGLRAWRDIQLSMTQGHLPAVEMAAAVQLLFAGVLLLTPGFVTDIIGFALMVPQLRLKLAGKMIASGVIIAATKSSSSTYRPDNGQTPSHQGRTIEGDFEKKD